jgi:hypothetical protein
MLEAEDLTGGITCAEVDSAMSNNPSGGGVFEIFNRIRRAQTHIFHCEICKKKYDTLATAVEKYSNKE